MKAAQLKARETAFTSAGNHEPVIFSFPTHDPGRYTSVQHIMVMHSAHNERKQETIVKILLAQSARYAKSAVLSLHGLRFNMNAFYIQDDRSTRAL